MKLDWREHFVRYGADQTFYIYCDTNASYCSVHQYLEGGEGRPCVVANGNASEQADAGACLAISYEARARGIKRGASLRRAKAMVKELVVYESCLPLYEVYAEMFDSILECIVPRPMFYRGSCDEVVIEFKAEKFYIRGFDDMVHQTLSFMKEKLGERCEFKISKEQHRDILSRAKWEQAIYAFGYLVRDGIQTYLGLPVSIGVAPSIALSKSLVDVAKPKVVKGERVYRTFHDAICFPSSAEEANAIFRPKYLADLCGVHEIARRFRDKVSIVNVGQFQDYVNLERSIQISKNLHLGRVIWHMSHGRDDVLSGYLAAIRDKK